MATSGNDYAVLDAMGSVGRSVTLAALLAYFGSMGRCRHFRPRDPWSFTLFTVSIALLTAGSILVAAIDLRLIPRWEIWWVISRWTMFGGAVAGAFAWRRAMPFMVEAKHND